MANLLRAPLTAEDIEKILDSVPRQPLLPPLGSAVWEQCSRNPIVTKWMLPLFKLAEKEIDRPMPVLTDDLYREFFTTGARLAFESVYFERRRILARAAMCALLDHTENKDTWTGSMYAKLEDIFSEFSWAVPGHVNSPSGKDPMQIDLFAAETANLMAEMIELFSAVLPKDLITRVKWRLRSQTFENYIHRHEDFWWTKATNNWNAVCHQGVIGAALSIEEDLELLSRMLALAKKYLPLFLRGFGSDGACSEGPGYWQYGFGWFCILNEQLVTRTRGELSLFEGDRQIEEIAKYGSRVSLANFHFVNFSDSPRTGTLSPTLLTYLGKQLKDETCRLQGYRSYQRLHETGINLQGLRSDLLYFARLFLNAPADLSQEVTISAEDVYFEDLGVIVAHAVDSKGNLWDFAAKAGNNAEHHNHNDCGNYILNVNGNALVVEIGAPEYTKDFFREKRYQFLAARTLGHSLPIVNGFEQAAGPQYASKVIRAVLSDDHVEFSIDLTACYPADAHCGEIVRTFYWDKREGKLRVKDFYELASYESFESSIIVERSVLIRDGTASIAAGESILVIKPGAATVFAGVEEHEYRDHLGSPRKVNRIILKPASVKEQREINYELSLVPLPAPIPINVESRSAEANPSTEEPPPPKEEL